MIAKERTGHDTGLEMLVNTLLTEMEGFKDKDPFKPVFVVAATNYGVAHSSGNPYEVVIDPALVRRFDNPVYVGLPDREDRRKYIRLLFREKGYTDKISEAAVDYMVEHTGGKSLAFLKRAVSNMTNIAIDQNKEINDDLLTDTLETKWYVVISGRTPGVYASWPECYEQVNGYRNAIYRAFLTEEDAKRAFQSSRIGTRNICDKKLLYHLVRLDDMGKVLKDGLCPKMQIGDKKYVEFVFHAYTPEALKEQKENPQATYAYLCITREYAAAHGYRILPGQQGRAELYSYEEGISKIDWEAMEEQIVVDAKSEVYCVTENPVHYAEISYIYLPDEERAAKLRTLLEKAGGQAGRGAVITVNKRMFT